MVGDDALKALNQEMANCTEDNAEWLLKKAHSKVAEHKLFLAQFNVVLKTFKLKMPKPSCVCPARPSTIHGA